MPEMADIVMLYEVGPRDGLQNEPHAVSTEDKIRLIDLLSDCGFAKIEAASFVSPKRVPQMADSAEVMASIKRRPGTIYAALVPNLEGYEAARHAQVGEVAVFASASEGFSKANINCTIAESLERFRPVCELARREGIPVRGYVSCVTDCPYDGPTPPCAVAAVAMALAKMGCHEISLGDTIGAATPDKTAVMLDAVLAVLPALRLAGHFHDTHGRALDNIKVCLDRGLRVFDASVAGLGGCPFAPGAKGNVATGTVADTLQALGVETGILRNKLRIAEAFAASLAGTSRDRKEA
jgi:hydroxymethylglutaryl-CoA lyase